MTLIECTFDRAPEVLDIFNEEILHTTALYDYRPRTMDNMRAWFEAKQKGKYPVLGMLADDGSLAGFASYGPFRAWPAYKYSIEHSVYVHKTQRGKGIGRALLGGILTEAQKQAYHTVIGGIDSGNTPSIRLHLSMGFVPCGRIEHAGFKFGRWLNLEFYQRILPTPECPVDG